MSATIRVARGFLIYQQLLDNLVLLSKLKDQELRIFYSQQAVE